MGMHPFTRGWAVAVAIALLPAMLVPGAARAAIEIVERTSPGGIVFWHMEEPSIPMVALEVSVAGGAALDPAENAGAANMAMSLMDEGAGERGASAFAAEAERLSARFGFSASRDRVSVSARMLVENLDASAGLMAEALASPRFDAEAVERVRGQILSNLASEETDPRDVAGKAWYARAFPGHPYGRPTDGTPDSVAALTREDLVAAHGRLLNRARATVGVVGALDAEAAGVLVDTVLAGLPAEAPSEAALPASPAAAPPPGVEIVDLPVPQSQVILGHAGLDRDDPDYIPAYVMNYVLGGGGFSSRLMTEVREKRGLAYGVYAYLADLEGAPLYISGVATANDRVAESIEVIRAEWARMASEGVSDEELAKAKQYLTGAFPLRFDTNAKIARFMVAAQEAGLGVDYVEIRNGLIEAVTREDIARVAARVLQPQALSVIVVGQPAGL